MGSTMPWIDARRPLCIPELIRARAGAPASTAASAAAHGRFVEQRRAAAAHRECRNRPLGAMTGFALRGSGSFRHRSALFELRPAGRAVILVDGHDQSIAEEQTDQAARVARRRRTRAAVRVAGAAVRCGISTISACSVAAPSGGNSATVPPRMARVMALDGSTHALPPVASCCERRRASRLFSQRNIHAMGGRQ